MEGQDLSLGHQIVHHAEKAFLHLPGVLCAEDHHFPPREVKVDARRGRHVVRVTVARELSSIVYREIRGTEILQLFGSGSDTPANPPGYPFFSLLLVTLLSWPLLFTSFFMYLINQCTLKHKNCAKKTLKKAHNTHTFRRLIWVV